MKLTRKRLKQIIREELQREERMSLAEGMEDLGAAIINDLIKRFKAGELKEDAQELIINELDEEESEGLMEFINDKKWEDVIDTTLTAVEGMIKASLNNDEDEFTSAKMFLQSALDRLAETLQAANLTPGGVAVGKLAYLDRINALWRGDPETAGSEPDVQEYRELRDRVARIMYRMHQ